MKFWSSEVFEVLRYSSFTNLRLRSWCCAFACQWLHVRIPICASLCSVIKLWQVTICTLKSKDTREVHISAKNCFADQLSHALSCVFGSGGLCSLAWTVNFELFQKKQRTMTRLPSNSFVRSAWQGGLKVVNIGGFPHETFSRSRCVIWPVRRIRLWSGLLTGHWEANSSACPAWTTSSAALFDLEGEFTVVCGRNETVVEENTVEKTVFKKGILSSSFVSSSLSSWSVLCQTGSWQISWCEVV